MDFDLTEEQRMLKDSVDRLIAERYSFEQRKAICATPTAAAASCGRAIADMGLLGLPFAESDGGLGGGPVDTMIVMEAHRPRTRARAVPRHRRAGGRLLRSGASAEQRATLGPAIAAGELLLAFAHSEAQSRYDLANVARQRRERDGNRWLDLERREALRAARR